MNRRTFVSSLATAGAAVATGSRLLSADAVSAPRPTVGMIGCGWWGGVILEFLATNAAIDIVSLCDPNANALKDTLVDVTKYQRPAVPRTFSDYREMLASTHHDIILIATPDHWHALPAIAAMQAGADLFLEKPVGVDVREGEALVAAARTYNRVVQVGTHRRSSAFCEEAREKYIRSGKLGAIGLVEGYCYLGVRATELPANTAPPPQLDYEMWTGPAPMRPFNPSIESKGWRAFMEYGNGVAGDMGVPIVDQARWMLGLGWPDSIHSTGGIYVDKASASNISDTQRSVFRYPGLDLSWEHRTWGGSQIPQRHWTDQWGAHYFGRNGTLTLTMLGYEFAPADGGPHEGFHLCSKTGNLENIDFTDWTPKYDDTMRRHVLDFMKARHARSRPVADIEEGHISTACCELANLAQELGRPLTYDPGTHTIPGDAGATGRLARPYRAPWMRPDPATV